ncbi:MAG: hypothetical protein ISR78_06140 [Spirochaetia bacterium]|nr:hypothetical protein [Spirochaetia bacterium]
MSKVKPQASACTNDNHSTVSRSRELSPKESRDLIFLHAILIDQMAWLLVNLDQIVSDSDGDIISSWLHRYVTDTSGKVKALPEVLWDGCLADYRTERDLILEQWWLATMGCRSCPVIQPASGELFSPRGVS